MFTIGDGLNWILVGVVGLGTSLIVSSTGIVVGAAARYGLPSSFRKQGAWSLAVAGAALLAFLAWLAIAEHKLNGYAFATAIVASLLPGFIAAVFGAKRWVLLGMIPTGWAASWLVTFVIGSAIASALISASSP